MDLTSANDKCRRTRRSRPELARDGDNRKASGPQEFLGPGQVSWGRLALEPRALARRSLRATSAKYGSAYPIFEPEHRPGRLVGAENPMTTSHATATPKTVGAYS